MVWEVAVAEREILIQMYVCPNKPVEHRPVLIERKSMRYMADVPSISQQPALGTCHMSNIDGCQLFPELKSTSDVTEKSFLDSSDQLNPPIQNLQCCVNGTAGPLV